MPGLLSNIFDDNVGAEDGYTTQQIDDGSSQDSDYSESSTDTGAEAQLNPSIDVHTELNASWENPDGSHSEYSQTLDVTLTTDTAASLAGNLDQSQFEG